MKIEGPKGPQGTSSARKAGGVSPLDAATFRGLMAPGQVEESAVTHATQNIAQLDALLAMQGAQDPTERATRKRMTIRSSDVLSALDRVRLGMLTGTMTVGDMIDVADVVATHRERVHDPELTALMDEIDLRAQVEIAKMRLALDDLPPPSAS